MKDAKCYFDDITKIMILKKSHKTISGIYCDVLKPTDPYSIFNSNSMQVYSYMKGRKK